MSTNTCVCSCSVANIAFLFCHQKQVENDKHWSLIDLQFCSKEGHTILSSNTNLIFNKRIFAEDIRLWNHYVAATVSSRWISNHNTAVSWKYSVHILYLPWSKTISTILTTDSYHIACQQIKGDRIFGWKHNLIWIISKIMLFYKKFNQLEFDLWCI